MSSENIANAKIIILHLVSDAPGLTYHMLMDKCLESLYMDYFTFSQGYNELIAANLLEKVSESDGTDQVTADSSEDILFITEGGKAVLDDIKGTLNQNTVNFLTKAKEDLNNQIADRNSIKANIRTVDDVFYADLSINDDKGPVFSTSIRCEDKESCTKICNSWKQNASKAFKSFTDLLK